MANPQKSYQHIVHASTCPCATNVQGDCNCFYSALSKTSIFKIATTEGPTGEDGHFTEIDQAQVREFVAEKKLEFGERGLQASPVQVYQPLLAGEIRVLELHSGESGSPLQGSLHTVSIDFSYPTRPYEYGLTRDTNHAVSLVTEQPVWFTALSYVWGANPIFDQTITSEHGPITITRSLAAALRELRSEHDSVYLWIDQICINQPDNEEKAMQIPLMDKIYTRATNTVIWLGDDDGEDPLKALDLMETIYARLQGTDAQVTPDEFKRLDFPPAEDRAWWAIRQFLRRPWFGRLWTIQEAVLSRNLFIKCGQAVISWVDFHAWCGCLVETGLLRWLKGNVGLDAEYGRIQPGILPSPQGAAVVLSISAERLNIMNFTHQESLLNILVATRYANATEPKDKIYGVLGIASLDIVPDYSEKTSARQVYLQACHTQLPFLVYELLSCVDHDTPLPISWVPDWSTQRVTAALGYSTKAWTVYRAGGQIAAGQQPPKVVVSNDKKEITLSGKVFDTITTLGEIYQDPTLDIETPQQNNQILASYAKIALDASTTHSYPIHDTSIYDAFFTTVLAGRDGSGTSAPTPNHSEVFSLILDCTTGTTPSLPGQTISPRRQSGHFSLDNLKTKKNAKIRQPAKTLEDLRIFYSKYHAQYLDGNLNEAEEAYVHILLLPARTTNPLLTPAAPPTQKPTSRQYLPLAAPSQPGHKQRAFI
ncbi:Heterokaryon incompatibility protein [Pyrenophora tritici-repentis]|nr:Heterokaryon incompatibility protein [Pyrenophora tritici-repentis]KAI2478892.1 Heterokaryon incompatibility protein [Pyrenophora tritici-repentis]PWO26665.1 lipase, class 3 [Pyrenophora tritici-repentis]PZD24990.1 heterokaryon incompatibility protein [Pyrenophora tritici-repentis]